MLQIHSLEAVGLTALFSNELANNNISSNLAVGCFHDYIFLETKDSLNKAVNIMHQFSKING